LKIAIPTRNIRCVNSKQAQKKREDSGRLDSASGTKHLTPKRNLEQKMKT
jgi:hypothetical protein